MGITSEWASEPLTVWRVVEGFVRLLTAGGIWLGIIYVSELMTPSEEALVSFWSIVGIFAVLVYLLEKTWPPGVG